MLKYTSLLESVTIAFSLISAMGGEIELNPASGLIKSILVVVSLACNSPNTLLRYLLLLLPLPDNYDVVFEVDVVD